MPKLLETFIRGTIEYLGGCIPTASRENQIKHNRENSETGDCKMCDPRAEAQPKTYSHAGTGRCLFRKDEKPCLVEQNTTINK